MKKIVYILLGVMLMLVCSCSSEEKGGEGISAIDSLADKALAIKDSVMMGTSAEDSLLNLTPQQVDSLVFRLSHHYSENFNFLVKADSLTLVPRDGDMLMDTCKVYDGDLIVVASIKTIPGDSIDSIWVKVAHDQFTMGWIPEEELLKGVVPDDMISEMLDALTGSRGFWMSAMVLLGVVGFLLRRGKANNLHIFRFDEMDGFYPCLFLTLITVMASLYASVQNFVPEYWQEYYFHPTLNPLELPLVMSVLVVLIWLVIIVYIAVIDEVYHHFYFGPGVAYLLELTGIAMIVYLVVSWSTLYYVGYLIAPIGLLWMWHRVIGFMR